MPDYPVLSELRHSGKTYFPAEGKTINLPENEAQPLIDLGVLGLSATPEPQPSQSVEEPAIEPQSVESIEPIFPTETPPPKVNLNTATRAMLEGLDEVGPATAKKLLAARPYESLEAAQAASGMPPEQWSKIADRVEV